MKPLTEQNYYEVLEIPFNALPLEIRRAYKRAVSLYEDGSIASYSFFSEQERREILACIETAYLTLISAEARSVYDRRLADLGVFREPGAHEAPSREPMAIYEFQKSAGYGSAQTQRIDTLRSLVAADPVIQDLLARESLTGADLRRIRTDLQVTLEEISRQTNIRVDILRAIEEENRELLPPPVYLKGFLKAYSRCLALDEAVVVTAYLKGVGKREAQPPKGD